MLGKLRYIQSSHSETQKVKQTNHPAIATLLAVLQAFSSPDVTLGVEIYSEEFND